jgi:hypothetical protein
VWEHEPTFETLSFFEIKVAQIVKPEFFKGIRVFNEASGNDPELSALVYEGESSYRHLQGGQVRAWFDLPKISL